MNGNRGEKGGRSGCFREKQQEENEKSAANDSFVYSVAANNTFHAQLVAGLFV